MVQEIYNCKLSFISYFLIYIIINTYISMGIVQSTLTFVMQILAFLLLYNKFIRVVVVDFQS